MTPKQTWPSRGSTSSRPTTSSQRSSRTSCSISTKPCRTWSTRRFTSCSPTACPARASSRRSTRSRTFTRTGERRLVSAAWTDPCRVHQTYLCFCLSFISWNKLTERFFKTSPWPEAEAIASLVGNGEFERVSVAFVENISLVFRLLLTLESKNIILMLIFTLILLFSHRCRVSHPL